MAEWMGMIILCIFLYAYLIVASIDFGAGLFLFYDKITSQPNMLNRLISRYLSPVWEIINVLFLFMLAGIVGSYPDTSYYYGSALLVPGAIVLVLFVIRGTFYALDNYGAKGSPVYSFIFGITGLVIPVVLSTAMTISEGEYISEQGKGIHLLVGKLFGSFYSWSVVILALVSVFYISASFLTYYAAKSKNDSARKLFRQYTLFWSAPTLLACILVFVALENHNFTHFENMVDQSWWFLLSLLSFLAAIGLIFWERHYGTAFFCVMLQFCFAFFGYTTTHLPYVLYPYIKINVAPGFPHMSQILMTALILLLALLIPILTLRMRLFYSKRNV